MCSIAVSNDKTEVLKMLQVMKHRAPDEEGIVEGEFNIGMGRLKIIDLKSDGLCPYKEGKYTITFNGEIYNYKEIRNELKLKGYNFRTNSDTEVLLKAYIEWKEKLFDKLNGMYAFAIYDGITVFFARDIAGEKPLYYTKKPFRIASEAKALNFECEELPPAHYGVYNGALKIKKYWEPKIKEIRLKWAEEELEYLLEDSIKLRTQADVPYGLYFSGGVDSSLISTFNGFEHLFSYEDKDYKEEFLELLPKIVHHLDYPVKSFSAFGLWKLAEEASKKVKVVLSGEGADELFGGYVRYVLPEFNRKAQLEFPSYTSMFTNPKSVNDNGWEEFNGNMQELLRMGDRMASAWGIENRCPFLDKRIIEFAYSLPEEAKIQGLDTKIILNRILKKRWPDYKRIEKKGLFCSVNDWIGAKDKFSKEEYVNLQRKYRNTV